MTKSNLHITMIFMVFFLSFNLISQVKNQWIIDSSIKGQQFEINKANNNIKVISILNPDNSDNWKRIDQFAEIYQYKNVSFIAITDKLNDSLSSSIKGEYNYYQHLSAIENEKVFNTHQTSMYKVFPIYIIINKDGKIIYKKKGATNNIEGKLAKRIDKLLETNGEDIEFQKVQYTIR